MAYSVSNIDYREWLVFGFISDNVLCRMVKRLCWADAGQMCQMRGQDGKTGEAKGVWGILQQPKLKLVISCNIKANVFTINI